MIAILALFCLVQLGALAFALGLAAVAFRIGDLLDTSRLPSDHRSEGRP